MNLTDFSINKPFFVLVFWMFIVVAGIQSFINLPVSFVSKDKFVKVSVTTSLPGAKKDKVLKDITKVLEHEILHLNETLDVYSVTENEVSEITVSFKKQIYEPEALAMIFLAVNKASENFPSGTITPVMKTIGPYSDPLFTIALTSDLPPEEFFDIANHKIKNSLEEIDGISYVKILGQRQRQATIELDLKKMKERELSASAVLSRLKDMGKNFYFGDHARSLLIGEFTNIEEIKSFTVNFLDNDRAVTLDEIADVREDLTKPSSYTYYNGKPCLFLEMYERKHANELDLERTIPVRLNALNNEYAPQNFTFNVLVNREPNLVPLVKDFKKNIWIAMSAALLIIWLVFKDAKSILISITSIPFSLCGAFLVLGIAQYSLNIHTILAFIVCTGLIIDDIIIIRENIFRHLELGLSPFAATRIGMKEMMNPITGTTSMLLAVALSMILVQKTATTQYLTNFGLTMFSCMAFSYLEALTLGPLLCAYFLSKKKPQEEKKSILQNISEKLLEWLHQYTRLILVFALVILTVGVVSSRFIRTVGMPQVDVGHIEIHRTLSLASKEELNEKSQEFARQIKTKYSDIENVALRVNDDNDIFYLQMVPKNVRNLTPYQLGVDLKEYLEHQRLEGEINKYEVLNSVLYSPTGLPDYGVEFTSYYKKSLNQYSEKIFRLLQDSHSLINLIDTANQKQRERRLIFNQEKMNLLGVEFTPLANEIDILMNGYEVDAVYNPFPVETDVVKTKIKINRSVGFDNIVDVANAFNINSKLVPMKSFTDTEFDSNYEKEIRRKNGMELTVIKGTTNPKKIRLNPQKITDRAILKELPLPSDVDMHWYAQTQKIADVHRMLPHLLGLSLFLIYMTLILLYQSITLPLIVVLPLPFSLMGSLIALLITGNTINVFSIIGITVTVGIAAKNGIILLKYTMQLIGEGMPFSEAIYAAVKVRLRPILMTSCGVLLTTIPILIPWSDYSKLQFSLGVAIIGGLVTSTFVTLLIFPVLFSYLYRFYLVLRNYFGRFINSDDAVDVLKKQSGDS